MELINYDKRKNQELFANLEQEVLTNLSEIQNYIPIYNRFFEMNETNYNSINLSHKWFITDIKEKNEEIKNVYKCKIKNGNTGKPKLRDVFFKMAPLLDPFKYLIGKYNINDPTLFNLPKYNSTISDVNPKIINTNNSAYVDGFFSFLSSLLIHKYNFCHGVDYYGSFLAIQNSFTFNVADDLEYLCKSDFFNKNKNILFQVEDFPTEMFDDDIYKPYKVPLKINTHNISNNSIKSIQDDIYENLFNDISSTSNSASESESLEELKELSVNLLDMTNMDINVDNSIKTSINMEDSNNNNNNNSSIKTTTIRSSSSCSSRTSHTGSQESCSNCSNSDGESDNTDNDDDENNDDDNNNNKENNEDTDDDDTSSYEEPCILATINKFPVQVICMENCEDTFDNLMMDTELSQEEWISAFMQIIMILITYQKVFSFTHNDLHSSNIMYNSTDKKYLYYCYDKVYYKVPTYGRIFKIIDFGRAIYKCNKLLFCSDSFQPGSDAATQYNIEPYFNEKKPRLEPNPSFDLCRLACSIFDTVVDDLDEIKNLKDCDEVVKLIVEWCLDDNGLNVLYKNNGDERYPDFKLYKMIARTVHKHIPKAQLNRKIFRQFIVKKLAITEELINIDNIPSCVL